MNVRLALLAFVVLLAVGSPLGQAQLKSASPPQIAVRTATVYDGNWWLKADELTRGGFLNGIADYLVAVKRVKWLVGSVDYGGEKIAEYYSRNPRDRALLVPDVWRRVVIESPPPRPSPGTEIWDGRHGYYLGRWYKTGLRLERLGYLEGYLWCLRTYGKQPAAAYPSPLEFYDERIIDDIDARNAWHEPIADILARFRASVPN